MKPRSAPTLVLAGAILLVCASAARAQTVVVEGASSAIATGAAIQFDHTVVTAARGYLVVGVAARSSAVTVVSVSYGGVALQRIVAAFAGGYCRAELWGLKGPAAGAHAVQVTLSGSNSAAAAGAISYAGVDQVTPIGGSASDYGNKGDVALALASAAGQRVVDCICGGAASAPTGSAAAGQTERWKLTAGNVLAGSSDRAGGSSATMNWTLSALAGQGWGSAGLTLRPAAVVDAGVPDAPAPPDVAAPATGGMTGTSGTGGASGTGGTGGSSTGPPDAMGSGGSAAAPDGPANPADAGGATDAPVNPPGDATTAPDAQNFKIGCACDLSGRPSGSGAWLTVAFLPLLAVRRRRRPR